MKISQQLSREAIDEFKAIYQEEFGETLSDDEVQEIAKRMMKDVERGHISGLVFSKLARLSRNT